MKLNNYNRWILSSVAVLALTACGGSSNNNNDNNNSGGSDDTPAKPTKNSIIHNGTVYGTVVSPITGRVWLDRNLGADRVCTAYNDAQCFGDYYQWGRGYDGHQDPHSDTTKTIISDIDNPHHMFVLSIHWYDVTDANDAKLIANWRVTDGSGVCPAGFYVPTSGDFIHEDEAFDGNSDYHLLGYKSFLKLPAAGNRGNKTGQTGTIPKLTVLWTSNDATSYLMSDKFSPGSSGGFDTANGHPLRCIKVK